MEQIFAEAFRKDLVTVLETYYNQKLPQSSQLSTHAKKRIQVDLNALSKSLYSLKFVSKKQEEAKNETGEESASQCTIVVQQKIEHILTSKGI
jgi:hypothetical protein